MISVKVGQGDQVRLHQADLRPARCSLRAFSAVKEDRAAAESQVRAGQCAFRKRHCGGSAEQSDVDQGSALLSFSGVDQMASLIVSDFPPAVNREIGKR